METMDSTALANFLLANPDLAEEALPPHLFDIEVMQTTIAETVLRLEEASCPRRDIASHVCNAVATFEVEDATILMMAATIYAQSRFTYPECVDYAYCLVDHREPHFENRELDLAFRERRFFSGLH